MRKFHSSEYLNALASGEICFVVGFSGDVKQAQKRAAEAKNGIELGYAIPKEGAQLWFDNLAIPRDARNVDEAHAFINFLQKPEVAAKNTNFISYANGNLASQAFIDKTMLDDRTIYPDAATMARLYTINAHDAEDHAADEPAVDADQDRQVTAVINASGGAARAIAPGCSRTQPSTTDGNRPASCAHVDAALRIARQLDRLGEFAAEMMAVGQPHRCGRRGSGIRGGARAGAIIGLALQGRPKNVTSTPRTSY